MANLKYIFIVVVVGGLAWWFLATYNPKPVENPALNGPENNPPVQHVAENPEGEADPARMKLDMTVWNWISAQYNDGTVIKPKVEKEFTLTFTKDGKFSVTTDCNDMWGSYVVSGKSLTFKDVTGTKRPCRADIQESDFRKILENTSSYFFTSRGELILELKYDSGTATFR